MKRPALCLAFFAALAVPALALESKLVDVDQPAAPKAPAVEFRANQINRCADAAGRVKLQDTPCSPTSPTPTAPPATAGAVDVVDLSALPPRTSDTSAAPSRGPAPADLTSLAISAAWRIALALTLGYGLFRLFRAWRESYALKEAVTETPRRTR